MVSGRFWIVVAVAIAIVGVGVTSYWALSKGRATVFGKEIDITPSTYTVKMNASSVYTKNVTVSTNDAEEITVTIKVLPGDYATSKAWGTDFVAFANPSEVKISKGTSAKVTIIHYGKEPGDYEVKVIAVR